jgi:hypothetical protein
LTEVAFSSRFTPLPGSAPAGVPIESVDDGRPKSKTVKEKGAT